MDRPFRVAVVGCGAIGSLHAAKFYAQPHCELRFVCDEDSARAERLAAAYPSCVPIDDYRRLSSEQVDAVSIATPASTHSEIALHLIQSNLSVFIEKPLAATVEQAERILHVAQASSATIQVGHIERYNPMVDELRKRVPTTSFIEVVRGGPYSHRGTDIDVVFDLMIHDIDLLSYLVGEDVVNVRAGGSSVFSDHIDIAQATICFANGLEAQLRASRVDPQVNRSMRLYHSEGVSTFDLREMVVSEMHSIPSEQGDGLGAHDGKGVIAGRIVANREIPLSNGTEIKHDALMDQISDFIGCCAEKRSPRVGLDDGLAAVRVASQIRSGISSHMERVVPRSVAETPTFFDLKEVV